MQNFLRQVDVKPLKNHNVYLYIYTKHAKIGPEIK